MYRGDAGSSLSSRTSSHSTSGQSRNRESPRARSAVSHVVDDQIVWDSCLVAEFVQGGEEPSAVMVFVKAESVEDWSERVDYQIVEAG